MPVTAELLTQGGLDASQSSYDTASVAPSGNTLQLLRVGYRGDTGATVSVTGCGLTWVLVDDQAENSYRILLFRAMGASPSSGALTIAFTSNPERVNWDLCEFGNVDTGGTNGSGAIVQAVKNATSGAGGLTVTLAAFSSEDNATYGAFLCGNGDFHASGSGFTQLASMLTGPEDQWYRIYGSTQWRNDNDTTVDVTWGYNLGVGIAVELKYAEGEPPPSVGVGITANFNRFPLHKLQR